ncbi:MAG: hypothetical protein QM771_16530 [Nitrospira sp.]
MSSVSYRSLIALVIPYVIVLPVTILSGCVPPPPHQFVPGGPVGEAGEPVAGPRQASSDEVRAMLEESSRHHQDPSGRVDLSGLLTQISQATTFRQKQHLVDQYHHAALLLPEAERNQAFQRLRELGDQHRMTQ